MKVSALILFVAALLATDFGHTSPGNEAVAAGDGGYGYVVIHVYPNRQDEGEPTAYYSSVFSYCSATFPRLSAQMQAEDELGATVDLPSSLSGANVSPFAHGGYEKRGEAVNERRKAMAEMRREGRLEVRTFGFEFYDENC